MLLAPLRDTALTSTSLSENLRIYLASFLFSISCLLADAGAEPPGKWQIRAPLPSSRSEVAAAELAGKIYVIGGYGKNGNLVEAYDPEKDRWHRGASLPKLLHHTGAAAVNGKLYIIGGYISGVGPVDTVYEYDPAADRWTAKKPMPTARGALAVGVIAGKFSRPEA